MKYQLNDVRIHGAICGRMWMPDCMGSNGFHDISVKHVLGRFSDASDATLRDVVLSELMRNGGDFQDARFSGDTTVTVTRSRKIPGGGYASHSRDVLLSAWPDCADLVHPDTYSSDFDNQE